jgi:hypothetical protein
MTSAEKKFIGRDVIKKKWFSKTKFLPAHAIGICLIMKAKLPLTSNF